MSELEKSLSFPTILLITVNSIMGTGIFFLPAIAAASAGNASIVSWVIMAIIAIGISIVFAELASMFPTAGGIYEYCKQAYGSFPSFIIGWATLIVGNVTIAMLVVGAIRYLNPALPDIWKISFSILFILLFNIMAYRGMQTSAAMLIAFAFITLGSLFGLLIPGFFQLQPSNLIPLFTHDWSVVFLGVFIVAETFFGWETVTFLAEETKDAERVIPRALIIGTVIIALIAIAFVVTSLGVIPWETFGLSQTPLASLASVLYGPGASPIFSVLVYISIIGSVAGWIVSSPRLIMSLAKDRMFVEAMADVHPVHKTPHKAIVFQTFLTSALVVFGAGSYERLLHLLVPLVLMLYTATIIALIVLRFTMPEHKRPFKAPLGIPLGVALAGALIAILLYWGVADTTALSTLATIGSLIGLGLPVYILLKFTYDPEALMSSAKMTGRLWVLLENILLPKSIRRHVISLLELTEKRVLELGANVGTLTLHLAEAVGPKGVVFASELSEHNASIVQKRMDVLGHSHVKVFHDPHQVNRVHPDIENVDIVVSIGFLSYIQDLPKVLRDLREKLPENGVVLFVEYVDFFKILPNAGVTANAEKLRKAFTEAGFSVSVLKRKGLLWNYLIVHGIKSDRHVPFI